MRFNARVESEGAEESDDSGDLYRLTWSEMRERHFASEQEAMQAARDLSVRSVLLRPDDSHDILDPADFGPK
jgi:hypothetical protein